MLQTYDPVYREELFEDRVEVAVYGAGRNWNFAGDTEEAIEAGNPGIVESLGWVMGDSGVNRALVPKPAFNAVVVGSEALTSERFPRFFRGADADGVVLTESGDSYLLASADCLSAVIYDVTRHRAVATHCGRDALVDRGALAGKPAREFPSVIDAGMKRVIDGGWTKSNSLQVFLAAGIGPATFTHPTTRTVAGSDGFEVANTYFEANAALIRFLTRMYNTRGFNVVTNQEQGNIDLVELVTAQLDAYGVTREQIVWDGFDTATDKDSRGQFLFHSNRRDRTRRNLVVVSLL